MTSTFDHALAPERVEERYEWQAENGEIIAVDSLEQLHAEPFELVGANRAQDLLARGGEVAADEFRRELAHGEAGNRGLRPDRLAIGRHRDRRMQIGRAH